MRRSLLTILTVAALAISANAQDVYSSSGQPLNRNKSNVKSDKLIDPQRIVFGGWGNFGIGSGVTNIGITPVLGYRITDGFSAGIGFGYQYLRVKDYFQVPVEILPTGESVWGFKNLNAHFYAPSVWMRHIIWNNIFAHVEYEHNITSYKKYEANVLSDPPFDETNVTESVPCLLVGAGIRQPLGARASIVFMLLYDVLQDPQSPYYQTFAIRAGVNFGF